MAKTQSQYIESDFCNGYRSNSEITNVSSKYLVKGSQNVLIKNKEKIVVRGGCELLGDAKTVNKGIKSSYDWTTNTNITRNLRKYYDELEVWFGGDWIRLMTGLKARKLQFTPWWSNTELIDELLFVDGSDTVYEWSGGITEVASVTSNTIKKKKYLSGTTYAFVNGGAAKDSITDSANGFVTAGFSVGDDIIVSGSTSNDGQYTVSDVEAGVLTLTADDELTNEDAGDTVVIRKLNTGSWAEERFLTAGTRSITIDGVPYAYNGGEDTGTLTGVTPDPTGAVVAGDIAIQTVRENNPTDLGGMDVDLISVLNNGVYYGSTRSRKGYISKTADFADCSYTSPLRKAGEGWSFDLDSCPRAFMPNKTEMYIGAGDNDLYKIVLTMNSAQDGESITVDRLATATGQAPINQDTVINIKNNVVFLTVEKTIDSLGSVAQIPTPETRPISDDIKDDLAEYDLTDASGIYFNREIRITLPREGIELIYDMQWGYWQPPQLRAIGRYAIIEIDGVRTLCGHSARANETYILDVGRNDNGATYKPMLVFGYERYGTRFDYKNFDEVATELYITKSTKVKQQVNYDYKGSTDIREFLIDPADTDLIFDRSDDDASFGAQPLGNHPLGMSTEEMASLVKMRIINTTDNVDFFERQRIYYSDSVDPYFEILGMAENVEKSENMPSFIKR
jgi:hypothetical protein